MKLGEAIKEMAHRARVTQKVLSEKAGYKTVSSVTTPIAKNEMNVSTLIRLANAVGYDVALVRRHALEPEYPIFISANEPDKADDSTSEEARG